MLEQYYIKKENSDGVVSFEPVDMDKITIMGKSVNEIATILNGLDIERIYNIKMTMENLETYANILNRERNEIIKNTTKYMFKTIEDYKNGEE